MEYIQQVFQDIGTGNPFNGAYAGYIQPCDLPHHSQRIISDWISYHQLTLDSVPSYNRIRRQQILQSRCISYDEFLTAFDSSINQTLNTALLKAQHTKTDHIIDLFYRKYPAYELLNLNQEEQRQRFIRSYQGNFESYIKFLQASNSPLTEFFFRCFDIYFPEKDRETHTYIVGKTGSGKSELLKVLIWQYILKDNKGLVVIDPNGDFAEQVAKFNENYPSHRRKKLVYIDPYLSKPHTPILNPFQIPDMSEYGIDLATQELAHTFEQIFNELGGALTLNMDTILEPCIATIIRIGGTLKDLQRFMDDNRNDDLVTFGKASPNREHRDFFMYEWDKGDFYKTKSSISTRVRRLLNSPTFTNLIVGNSTIQLSDLLEKQYLVVFNLSKGKMGKRASKSYGKILVAMIQTIVLQRSHQDEKNRKPVHLFIDEFQNYVSGTIEEIASESRKYKLYLTIANQVYGQKMTDEMKAVIVGNMNIRIIGKNDYKSRTEMAKEFSMKAVELKDLKMGRFYAQIGSGEPFIFKVGTKLLKHKNSMSDNKWEEIKAEQINNYYVSKSDPFQKDHNIDLDEYPIEDPDTPATPDPTPHLPIRKKRGNTFNTKLGL
jgi:ABC-type oligopeptide transport system ATPase subunit